MYLTTLFWESIHRYHLSFREVMAQEKVKNTDIFFWSFWLFKNIFLFSLFLEDFFFFFDGH